MKGLTKTILIAVLAIAFISIFPQKIPSQGPFLYCVVHFGMENKDRYCYADDLEAECGWEPEGYHIPPFGNWGVDSNISARYDGDQFQGWKWTQFWFHWDWNSCTHFDHGWHPPRFCGSFYNAKQTSEGCWEQKQEDSTGINSYAGGVNYMEIPREFQDDG